MEDPAGRIGLPIVRVTPLRAGRLFPRVEVLERPRDPCRILDGRDRPRKVRSEVREDIEVVSVPSGVPERTRGLRGNVGVDPSGIRSLHVRHGIGPCIRIPPFDILDRPMRILRAERDRSPVGIHAGVIEPEEPWVCARAHAEGNRPSSGVGSRTGLEGDGAQNRLVRRCRNRPGQRQGVGSAVVASRDASTRRGRENVTWLPAAHHHCRTDNLSNRCTGDREGRIDDHTLTSGGPDRRGRH